MIRSRDNVLDKGFAWIVAAQFGGHPSGVNGYLIQGLEADAEPRGRREGIPPPENFIDTVYRAADGFPQNGFDRPRHAATEPQRKDYRMQSSALHLSVHHRRRP